MWNVYVYRPLTIAEINEDVRILVSGNGRKWKVIEAGLNERLPIAREQVTLEDVNLVNDRITLDPLHLMKAFRFASNGTPFGVELEGIDSWEDQAVFFAECRGKYVALKLQRDHGF